MPENAFRYVYWYYDSYDPSKTRQIINWENGLEKAWQVDYLCQGKATASWSAPVIQVADVSIDTSNHQVVVSGKSVRLSAMEYRLLEYLAMRAGDVVSKTDIMEHMYSFCSENFSNVVEVYICSLRRKLGSVSKSKLIHTFRGQGYLLGEPPA